MTKMIMHGCNGRMGHMIIDLVKEDENIEVVAGVDAFGESTYDFPVFKSLSECTVDADVIVDFSNASAVDGLLDHCVSKKIPAVLCSGGLSEPCPQRMPPRSSEPSETPPMWSRSRRFPARGPRRDRWSGLLSFCSWVNLLC